MIRSAFEILSWYLSLRRLPWFAVAEFAVGLGATTIGYELTGDQGWIIAACLGVGAGTYFAFWHYAELERRPDTKRERERLEREFAERWERMSPATQTRYREFGRNVAALAKAGTVDMETAARNMQANFAALRRSS